MDKENKETIKSIKKKLKSMNKEEKKEYYGQIYSLYGKNIFHKIVPKKYKEDDLDNLLAEGKFQDIYFKYGEKTYNENLTYMRQQDVEYETGSKIKGWLSKMGSSIKDIVKKKIPTALVTLGLGLPTMVTISAEASKAREYEENVEKIEEYIENINEYGEEVSQMNLTQIEVMMKVMDDMWKNIKGYGTPQINLLSYAGLDLATEEGQGVCRNMADDVARKLNAIDEEYNARVITVYFDTTKTGYKTADIEQNVIQSNETVLDESENESGEESQLKDDLMTKLVGNHAIVALEVKEDNATIMLDPTNPGIGIYKDGEIVMFNSEGYKEEDKINFERTYFMPIMYEGLDGLKVPFEILNTFREPNLSMEELKQKYGLEAQNKALENVREKSKSFKDTIKVDLESGDTVYIDFKNQQENVKDNDNFER